MMPPPDDEGPFDWLTTLPVTAWTAGAWACAVAVALVGVGICAGAALFHG